MRLIDRFAAGIETLGKRANQALDEGKLRMELVQVRRRMDKAARDLGYITYRQAKGTEALPAEVEVLTRRIADGETAAARIEADIEQVRQRARAAPAAAAAPAAGDSGSTASYSGPADAASPPATGDAPPPPDAPTNT
jgi:hypothetical protein